MIHAGFLYDFNRFDAACAVEGRALETMGAVLAGSDGLVILTAGVALGGMARWLWNGTCQSCTALKHFHFMLRHIRQHEGSSSIPAG